MITIDSREHYGPDWLLADRPYQTDLTEQGARVALHVWMENGQPQFTPARIMKVIADRARKAEQLRRRQP